MQNIIVKMLKRLASLTAIFNYAYAELDLDKRNPFSRMIIKGEGDDSLKRGVFTNDQLKLGYDKALKSGSQIKLLMPLLGETGCRLAEIVGPSLKTTMMAPSLSFIIA